MIVLSLGAGVQSTTMALLAAAGKLGPMPDCAIFADTGNEPRDVYLHLQWLLGLGPALVTGSWRPPAAGFRAAEIPFPIYIARAWEGYGNPSIKAPLGQEILAAARGIAKPGSEGTSSAGMHSRPPFFTLEADGKKGMIRRQCTGDYKLDVIQAKERELLGLSKRQRWPREILIEQWIGISADEATRAKPILRRRRNHLPPEPHPTILARWPLLEAGHTRRWCLEWLRANGFHEPPKSACTFCPFHSDAEWRRIKQDPVAWAEAVEIDEGIRGGLVAKALRGALFVHASRVPLKDVDLSTPEERGQINLFENECEGMCGV